MPLIKTIKGKILLAVAIGFVTLLILCIYTPFYGLGSKTEQEIHDWALSRAPVGSSVEEVQTFIQSQGWEQNYNWKGTPDHSSETFYPGVKGGHIIGANLGQFRGLFFTCNIDAYWGFDANGKLIELRVRKMYDGL